MYYDIELREYTDDDGTQRFCVNCRVRDCKEYQSYKVKELFKAQFPKDKFEGSSEFDLDFPLNKKTERKLRILTNTLDKIQAYDYSDIFEGFDELNDFYKKIYLRMQSHVLGEFLKDKNGSTMPALFRHRRIRIEQEGTKISATYYTKRDADTQMRKGIVDRSTSLWLMVNDMAKGYENQNPGISVQVERINHKTYRIVLDVETKIKEDQRKELAKSLIDTLGDLDMDKLYEVQNIIKGKK